MNRTPQMAASPPRPFEVPWRIRDAAFIVLWTDLSLLGCIVVLALTLTVSFQIQGIPLPEQEWFDALDRAPGFDLFLLIQSLLMALYLSLCILRPRAVRWPVFFSPGQAAPDARAALRLLAWCILISAAILVATLGLIAGVAALMGQESQTVLATYFEGVEREAEVFSASRMGWLGELDTILIAPPLEELVYRGCLYGALRKRLTPWQANAISSGAFALGHHYVLGLPTILVVGIGSAYAYERTRSLRAPILFHMFWNTLCGASERPWLWVAFVAAAGGLFAWARWASWKARAHRPWAEAQPWWWLWWRLYAWSFVSASLMLHAGNPPEAWKGLVEFPVYLALFSYAYGKALLPRVWWVVYGLFYIGWVVRALDGLCGRDLFHELTQAALAEGFPGPLAAAFGAGFGLSVLWLTFLCIAPSVIVVRRLAMRGSA